MVKKTFGRYFSFDPILLGLLVLSLIIFYFQLWPGLYFNYVLIVLSLVGTIPVIASALLAIKDKHVSVDLLASVALVFSLLSGEWVSAIFINLMLTSARIFLAYSNERARQNIESLLKLKPTKVKVKKDGKVIEVSPSEVKVGDLVIVELGERLPVDGTVMSGEAEIDQSSLTGESLPVSRCCGQEVFSSTMVVSGNLVVATKKIGADTSLEKIIDLVENAQANKAGISTLADKFSTIYIIVMLVASVGLYLWLHNTGLVLSVLLVVCADDIAVAVPMAYLSAIGYGAKRGVIIKGANYLEAISQAKVLVVDKTGTLTTGKLQVNQVIHFDGLPDKEVLALAGSTASVSDHPVAKAILAFVRQEGAIFTPADEFKEIEGKGAWAKEGGKEIRLGRPAYLQESGVVISAADLAKIKEAETGGYNVTLLSVDKKLEAAFVLADALKPHIKETIAELQKDGIAQIIMLTGDNEKIAKRVADEIGIKTYHANLLPADKLKYLKKYLNKKYKVIMAGDGVNDAASLALADIGIAMGKGGLDAAIESADIVLMKDDFKKIHEVIKLSLYVKKVVVQNFWIWGIVNAIGLVLVFTDVIHPTGAAAYNFATDFLPLINSSRIFGLYLKGR